MNQALNIPEGYQTVMPYLILDNADAFSTFIQKVFGAQEINRYPAPDGDGIMHAEARIGDSMVMFADSGGPYAVQNAGMYIHVADVDAAYKTALNEGATSVFEPVEKDYGYTAGIVDPFGNTWWLAKA